MFLLYVFKRVKNSPYLFLSFSMLLFFGTLYYLNIQQKVALVIMFISLFSILNFILSFALGVNQKPNLK